MKNQEDIVEELSYTGKDVTPMDLLIFARQILHNLMVVFILSWMADYLIPDRGIFECCKTVIPSITTLVIGYYFGKTN